jgi:hypothetical protein
LQETQGNTHIETHDDAESDARDDGYVEPPPIIGTAPILLRRNALSFDSLVVRGDFNAPAAEASDREPIARPMPGASPRPAIDAAQEEADLRLWLSLPEAVRRESLERIESAVTAHPAPEAGRIIAAWRTVPEGLKAEWRKMLSRAAVGKAVSAAASVAAPVS